MEATYRDAAQPSRSRRLLILLICSMSLLIVGLDTTIVNVALPAIHRSLHASVQGLQWTLDAYTLVLASLLMLGGSTADRLGRRRIFQIGLITFALGSLLCALAPTLGLLIAARVIQAIGGSMLNPVAMSIIRNVFTDPRERAQAIGVWAGVIGISMALGPLAGGALVDSAGWRWVFLVNVPIGLVAVALTAAFVPESRAPRARRVDPIGQALVIAGLASLTYAIIEGGADGWVSMPVLASLAVAIASFAGLISYERRREDPLLDMRFFGSVPFSGASVAAICAFAMLGGFLFLNTLYLQDVRGFTPLEAGTRLLSMAAMTLLFAPLSGRLVGRSGARPSLVAGGLALLASAILMTRVGPGTSTAMLALSYLVFGFGFGIVNPPITNTAVSGMPAAQAGVASSIASTSRQVGMTLGVALTGALAGSGIAGLRDGHAFALATRSSWWLLVGLATIITVLGVGTTTRRAMTTAHRTAELFPEPGAITGPAAEPAPAVLA